MKTILGTEISLSTRGVYYMCKFDPINLTLEVTHEVITDDAWLAIGMYAEIPNPESQIATGKTYEQLCERLQKLHENMKDKEWLENLKECL